MHSTEMSSSVVVNINADSSSSVNKLQQIAEESSNNCNLKSDSEKQRLQNKINDKMKLLNIPMAKESNIQYQSDCNRLDNSANNARHRLIPNECKDASSRSNLSTRSNNSSLNEKSIPPKDVSKYNMNENVRKSSTRRKKLGSVSPEMERSTYSSTSSSDLSCSDSNSFDDDDSQSSSTSSGQPNLPHPGFPEVAFKYLTQYTKPRNWCLLLIINPWFERISIIVILLNCITLGMYQPCVDDACVSNRCQILQIFDDIIFAFFALEMTIKMVAMGLYGKNTYLADSWNRLDFFIVLAGLLEYIMHVENLNLTAIRTIRVLRPLRAINRIPSMRILVMLLLDTLPMLGNVLLLCFFVFFIFGIIGVQLWEGILRQRCFLVPPPGIEIPNISFYYEFSKEQDYICSKPGDSGMHLCSNLPPYRIGPMICTEKAKPYQDNRPTNTSCVNWNQYYSVCNNTEFNPFQGTISFDNIGMAWVAIFLVISLEGWTDIMYYVQDAHSFWDWIYFVLLIVIGSFFMINLCLVVIATQFSETKKREMERMRQERARYTSSSTLASSTNNSEPATCYAEIVKYIAHLWRRFKRRMLKKYRQYKSQRNQKKELLPNVENLTFSPSRIKGHHPKCAKFKNSKTISGAEQLITLMVPLNSNNNTRVGSSNSNSNGSNGSNALVAINGLTTSSNPYGRKLNSSADNSDQSSENSNQEKNFQMSKADQKAIATISNCLNGAENDQNLNKFQQPKTILLKFPSRIQDTEQLLLQLGGLGKNQPCNSGFLSPPSGGSRRPSVMFKEYVLLHTPPVLNEKTLGDKQIYSTEKMTQTSDGSIWQVNLPQPLAGAANSFIDCSELGVHDAMTCQELLAFSVAFSAVLPTGHSTLESFFTSLTRTNDEANKSNCQNDKKIKSKNAKECTKLVESSELNDKLVEDYSCCYDLYQNGFSPLEENKQYSPGFMRCLNVYRCLSNVCSVIRRYIKLLVEHKYFQQGILLAILINTLSMGIEYHKQPMILTVAVEISNIVFSAIFAVEMLLKVIAEGPFRYIANGFNVFDGVIVILSGIEICQQYLGNGGVGGGSGLSVLRTFRLLRILKLVRFMPNLRRQLFVMLRTMDNVAVFFSLLVLFIFIFSILGMNLFGCKFCETIDGEPVCDRKNFDSLLWALVTVFQILTQEDWNVVLFNGMEKTSHWAALYFVALMTFGNYVLFNLLVAILVEGFSSERNERREREQRELVKKLREETLAETYSDIIKEESKSDDDSSGTNDSFYEIKNRSRSADDFRKFYVPKSTDEEKKQKMYATRMQGSEDSDYNRSIMTNESSKNESHDKNHIRKANSMKKRRFEGPKIAKLKTFREPPIITTTAATPQDSPSATLEEVMHERSWDQIDENELTILPTYLKPPTLFSSQTALEEGIPTSEESSGSFRKPLNILNASQLSTNNSCKSFMKNSNLLPVAPPSSIQNVVIDDISKSSTSTITGPIYVPTISSTAATLQAPVPAHLLTEHIPLPPSASEDKQHLPFTLNNAATSRSEPAAMQISNKRYRRMSSKKKSTINNLMAEDNAEHQHNNLNDNSLLLDSNASLSLADNPNKTKDTTASMLSSQGNRYSKQPNVGQYFKNRRASTCLSNSHMYNIYNPTLSSIPSQRRMSSFEINCRKAPNMQMSNMDASGKSLSYSSSKSELDKWQMPFLNANEPDMLQQYIEARDKRKNSISQQSLKKRLKEQSDMKNQEMTNSDLITEPVSKINILINRLNLNYIFDERESYSLYIFSHEMRFRRICTWLVNQKWFDNVVLFFIALNCITLAMERPNIPPDSPERLFLSTANYVFTVVFTVEMFIKVVATGMFYGHDAYFTSGWNLMDGSLVMISIIDLLMSLISQSSPRIFGILRVFRLLRSLRPLRVINRAPGLKLVVQTLLSSLRPIGNIVLICCTFFIIFGILGVQLFKGTFYYCEGENIKNVRNKTDCLQHPGNAWVNRKYNFDDLGKALMSLFVLSSRDGWVNIMYTGLDAVGVDQQPIVNYNEWRLLYFIAFILLVGFFVLNMFVGVVVENFHRCREEQEKEEKIRRAAKRALQMEKKRRRMHEPPYYTNYSPTRMFVHNVVTSKYFDLAIAAVIGLNVVTMAMEYYRMPLALQYALKIFNYFFTAVFILEANMKFVALGFRLYMKDKWNQLDVGIVILSIVGIILEELENNIIPINPTIIRVMRVMRIARVLKLLKMAKGIRALLDTVMQALPQVGNLGLLFFLLFFIFAALGVELFGRLECSDEFPCQGLGEHAHFANFGMAFLTLFRVATGDNWSGIMKDTLRDNCDDSTDCVRNCCVSSVIAPIFFVIFVLMAQFVLVNVVVAVLMRHLEESHKQMEDEMDMEVELERELVREQELEQEQKLCQQLQHQTTLTPVPRHLSKVKSLPMNFTYNTPTLDKKVQSSSMVSDIRRQTLEMSEQRCRETEAEVNKTLNQNQFQIDNFLANTEENNSKRILLMHHQQYAGPQKVLRPAERRRARLQKEQSLDERTLCKRNVEGTRTSYDSLPNSCISLDVKDQIIFENLETNNQSLAPYNALHKRLETDAKNTNAAETTTPQQAKPGNTVGGAAARKCYRRSFSSDQGQKPSSRLLTVPRSIVGHSRSGSTKQLFKQQALDEDVDMDESSLLLPVANLKKNHRGSLNEKNNQKAKNEEANNKNDASSSSDIMRIISERRKIDQLDNFGNQDSDYKDLLLFKSHQSSMEAFR